MTAGGLSIHEQFSHSTVLLTGATGKQQCHAVAHWLAPLLTFLWLSTCGVPGYVGGLVLEALLRTTAVSKVYVLLRAKGSQTPQQRLSALLQVGSTDHCHRCCLAAVVKQTV